MLATPGKLLLVVSPMAMALVRSGARALETQPPTLKAWRRVPLPKQAFVRFDHSGRARRLPSGPGIQPLPSRNDLDRDAIDRQRVPLIASDDNPPAFAG